MADFELSYTAQEIDERLGTVNENKNRIDSMQTEVERMTVELTNKQDSSTAITTSNIGSQSVNYATTADTATVATKLKGHAGNTMTDMVFNWIGQDGQPSWVWGGGTDGKNMYVYNPANFNANNGIIATGTANGGYYYKFGSGLLICVKDIYTGAIPCETQWGSMYETAKIDLGYWPLAFTTRPTVYLGWYPEQGAAFIEGQQKVTNTHAGTTQLCRPTAIGLQGYVSVLGVGRWK